MRPVTVFLVLRLSLPTPSHVGHPPVPGEQGAMPPAATTFDRVFWPQNCTCDGNREEARLVSHIKPGTASRNSSHTLSLTSDRRSLPGQAGQT